MADQAFDLLDRHIGLKADADPETPIQMRAVAHAGILLAQDLRQVWVTFEDDGLRAPEGQNGEHLSDDLVDHDAGRGGQGRTHGPGHGLHTGFHSSDLIIDPQGTTPLAG